MPRTRKKKPTDVPEEVLDHVERPESARRRAPDDLHGAQTRTAPPRPSRHLRPGRGASALRGKEANFWFTLHGAERAVTNRPAHRNSDNPAMSTPSVARSLF